MTKQKVESAVKQKVRLGQKKPTGKRERPYSIEKLKEEMAFLRKDGSSFRAELTKMEEKLSKLLKDENLRGRSQLDLIGEIEDDLHKRHTVIKNIKHELIEAQEKVAETDKAIKSRDDKIAGLREEVSELKNRVEEQKGKYLEDMRELDRAKDEQTERLKDEITNLNKTISELEESNQAKEAKADLLTERDNEISTLKQTVAEMEEALKTKDEAIGELKEEISNFKKTIGDLEKSSKAGESIEEKDKEIVRLKADATWLKELNDAYKIQREIERKKEKMTPEPDKILAQKEAEIEELKGEIFSLRELASTQKGFIERLEKAGSLGDKDTRS